MKLKVKQNDTVVITAEGEDEDAAIEAAQAYLSANL
jgi:phosphotransferase system HPr-like phosphotransfer protein